VSHVPRAHSRERRRWGRSAKGLLLLAPFALTPLLSSITADNLGVQLGRDAAESAIDLRPTSPPELMPLSELGIGDGVGIPLHYFPRGAEPAAWTSHDAAGRSSSGTAMGSRPTGLLIRAGVILKAAQSGAQPVGVPVAASGMRPQGLALGGVSGHGGGLRDGDVLTRIAGIHATSEGAVVAAVTRAVQAGVPAIAAEVWRRDQRMIVTVEIPTLDSDDE